MPCVPATQKRVWDPLLRGCHWLLAGAILVAWLTRHGAGWVHEWAGYLVLGVILLRLVWGWTGPRRARFADFVRTPRRTLTYACLVLRGRAPRHVGHNPLGGWMIVALMLVAAAASATGWLFVTQRFWGVEWVEDTHAALADLLLGLLALHVAGVLYESLRHRENLVAAMFHGRKRAAAGDDVD